MSPIPPTAVLTALDGKVTTLAVSFVLDSRTIAMAEPTWDQVTLARAALHLGDDEPNKAVAMLLGSGLEAMCRADNDQAIIALGAVVDLLKGITESQAEGIVS